jgi:zinc/manganese transport system substrate-binding protein/manganese/iron transport system substrate-binding protein
MNPPTTQCSALARRAPYLLPLIMLLLAAACGPQPADGQPAAATAGAPIKVVTTMSVLADMVTRVGGARVAAENIIPLGAGPEDYQPTPADAQKIAGAAVVFYNGHGLEDWLADLLKSAARPGQPQIAVSEGLPAIGASDEFKDGNPHFWMSAALGAKYVERIRDGLIAADPAGRSAYTSNAAAYIQQLLDLNAELKRQAATLPDTSRKMVTNHDAFPYFAREYGFTIVGDVLGNPASEPSAGDLAELVRRIQAEQVKAVFSEAQFSPKLAQTIAAEAGVKVIANLYTDTLGEPGSGVSSYVELLRYDMQEIVEALR